MSYKELATLYASKGLSVIPIKRGEKRPAFSRWQTYCGRVPTTKEIEEWARDFPDCNVGLCLGIHSGDIQIGAIDVDDDEIMEAVRKALPAPTPTKRGKKGMTFIITAPQDWKNKKINRMKEGKRSSKPSVEFLFNGSQTVIPPSIHPDTQKPYEWVDYEMFSTKCALIDDFVRDEIGAWCEEKAEHFEALNTMVWAGVSGGGNTHDVCLAAVAHLIARDWPDTAIFRRIDRAKREAVERAGEVYDWPEGPTTIQGWIDSARKKFDSGLMTGKVLKEKKIPPERRAADWLIAEHGGNENLACVQGTLRRYTNGYWKEMSVEGLKKELYISDSSYAKSQVNNALEIMHTLVYAEQFGSTAGLPMSKDPMKRRICLLNGTFDIIEQRLVKHAPEHQLVNQLNFEYDDKAVCPVYDQTVSDIFEGDAKSINLWNEFCALTLVPDISFQVMLFVLGDRNAGKSTLAQVLRSMHDPVTVSAVDITKLDDERQRTTLVGKLVNIGAEKSDDGKISAKYFKAITGGDAIDVRRLYEEVMNTVVYARFVEFCNDLPRTVDTGGAMKRRLLILRTRKAIPAHLRKRDFYHELEAERPGIFRRWVSEDFPRLLARGGFDIPERSKLEVDDYLKTNDNVQLWLESETQSDERPTSNKELYANYSQWCKNNNYRPRPEVFWGKALNEFGFNTVVAKQGNKSIRARKLSLKFEEIF